MIHAQDLPFITSLQWIPLVRREFQRLASGIGIWVYLLGTFVIYFTTYKSVIDVYHLIGPDAIILHLQSIMSGIILVGALVLSYRSIIKERQTGQIKLTAAMPLSRGEIVLAKYVAIGTILSLATLVVVSIVTAFTIIFYGVPRLLPLFIFTVILVAKIFLFVGIGLAISSSIKSPLRATSVMLTTILLAALWQDIISQIYVYIIGESFNPLSLPPDGILFFIRRIDPIGSYFVITNWLYGTGNAAGPFWGSVKKLNSEPWSGYSSDIHPLEVVFGESIPLYLAEPVSVFVFLFWLIVPILVAIKLFERAILY